MAQLAGQPFFEGSLYLDGNLEVEAVEAPERTAYILILLLRRLILLQGCSMDLSVC